MQSVHRITDVAANTTDGNPDSDADQPGATGTSPVNTGDLPDFSSVNLDATELYLNRELSYLQFNLRVLDQARNDRHPLLERLMFLLIFSSNLDEFYEIRISGLKKQLEFGR